MAAMNKWKRNVSVCRGHELANALYVDVLWYILPHNHKIWYFKVNFLYLHVNKIHFTARGSRLFNSFSLPKIGHWDKRNDFFYELTLDTRENDWCSQRLLCVTVNCKHVLVVMERISAVSKCFTRKKGFDVHSIEARRLCLSLSTTCT